MLKHLRLLYLLIVLSGASLTLAAQTMPKYNLDFEGAENGELPPGWFQVGEYSIVTDTLAYRNQTSGKIISTESGKSFGTIAYRIPAIYQGKSIRLVGYIKVKDVTDGHAGLMIRIEGDGSVLALDNMSDQAIRGTRNWQQYSINLAYPVDATTIYVGGFLSGKGEAWFDEFTLTIDGEDVQVKEEVAPITYLADDDHAYDTGSDVNLPEITPAVIDDLELLGRVWGFLKYHHPVIARGERQWDYDLFRVLPDYLAAGTQVQKESVIEQWILALGTVPDCGDDCIFKDPNAALTASQDWIGEDVSVESLRSTLRQIFENRIKVNHYYIGASGELSNPDFRHERDYANMPYPDAGFRLLSLYRYWNMIRYYFPYVAETDNDWEDLLATYLPIFLEAEDELAYELAVLKLIGEVHDTHANLWSGGDKIAETRGNHYAAVHVRFVEDRLVVTDFYNKDLEPATDLAVGDVITSIDGTPVTELVTSLKTSYPASNQPTRLRDISSNILRSTNDRLTIDIERPSGPATVSIPLFGESTVNRYRSYPPVDGPSFRLLSDDIGYITLQNIKLEDVEAIKNEFRNTRGTIVDIRNYPSAFMPFALGPWLMSEPTPFVKFTEVNYATPGEFILSDPLEIPSTEDHYTGKIIVLVNELTQSQAEYTAMALRAGPNTTVIGSTTAGADGNVSAIVLPGGLRTMISGIGIFYPDGTPTQRVGIVPDVVVPPTIKGIRSGRDELLERGIELIRR